ncbi:uncharacterized protein [Spinacia oleracea]|uniref:Uncharacterized protein isoform X1 n=1 Tax=Spinacia oleracea TaxID=3562 RepID=A0A9R0J8K1_SPIOL|nr:uncharacterized protein LOC110801386 isoform X1 [Spinacia oleracea]
MGELPRFIVLGRPTGGVTYLRYVVERGAQHRRLHLSSPEVISERNFTKLEVVRAPPTIGRDMVHIRSCYNNKFLVLESEGSNVFVAEADEPEVDRSIWSCTLFRVTYVNNRLSLLLQSSNAQHSVQVLSNSSLGIAVRNSPFAYWFDVTNMSTLAILPEYIAFKGDNNRYLNSRHIRTQNRLKYESTNLLDTGVHHQTQTLRNGNVRFRSIHFGRFWRKSNPEWIFGDSDDRTGSDINTVFRPIKLDGNKISLLNLGNNRYCMRRVQGGQPKLVDTLTASSSTVGPLTVMEVEEAVRQREIYNIHYNMDESRVYNVAPFESGNVTQDTYNLTPLPVVKRVGFKYTQVTRETFNSSHSWKVAYNSKIKVTVIPKFVEGEATLEASYDGKVEWSELNETIITQTKDLFIPVPPMTKSIVTLILGRGSVDVPFSYEQRDILPNGREVHKHMEDGLFSGLNTEVFTHTVREISLSTLSESELEEARRLSVVDEEAAAPALSSKL